MLNSGASADQALDSNIELTILPTTCPNMVICPEKVEKPKIEFVNLVIMM